jgi:hypothetical protein
MGFFSALNGIAVYGHQINLIIILKFYMKLIQLNVKVPVIMHLHIAEKFPWKTKSILSTSALCT